MTKDGKKLYRIQNYGNQAAYGSPGPFDGGYAYPVNEGGYLIK